MRPHKAHVRNFAGVQRFEGQPSPGLSAQEGDRADQSRSVHIVHTGPPMCGLHAVLRA